MNILFQNVKSYILSARLQLLTYRVYGKRLYSTQHYFYGHYRQNVPFLFFVFWLSRFKCTFSSHELCLGSYKCHRKHNPFIITTPHLSTLMSYECCHWTSFGNETDNIEKQNHIYKITAQIHNVSGKFTPFIRNCKLRSSCNNWISRSMKEKLNA